MMKTSWYFEWTESIVAVARRESAPTIESSVEASKKSGIVKAPVRGAWDDRQGN